jgi:hypothetical protein
MKITHEGYEFDDKTDWAAYLDRAVQKGVVWGLRDDLELSAGLSELAYALEQGAPPLLQAMADEALKIIETGDQHAVNTVRRINYEEAPNGYDRILRLVEHDHARLERLKLLSGVFHSALTKWTQDARIRKALADNIVRYPQDANLAKTAAIFP